MANVSQQFMDDLGPLGALWAGRDQGMQENTTQVNQQNALEQIANSQQNRDIAKQKLPFELSALQHKQALQPGELEQQGIETKTKLQKLNKDQFDTFFGQFKDTLPTLSGTPADGAILGEIAKKNGMDPADPRIQRMIQTATSGNRAAIDNMLKRIYTLSEKGQERAAQEAGATERTNIQGRTQRDVATIQADASLERAQIMAQAKAAATQRLASIDQRLVQLTNVINDPNADPQEKRRAQAEAAQLSQYKVALATAVNTQKTDQVMQLLGQPTSGVPTQGNPYTQPAQETQAPAQPAFDPNKQYTPAEASKLPKGTKFKGTDGKTYEVQ